MSCGNFLPLVQPQSFFPSPLITRRAKKHGLTMAAGPHNKLG